MLAWYRTFRSTLARRKEKKRIDVLYAAGHCQCDRCLGKEPWPAPGYTTMTFTLSEKDAESLGIAPIDRVFDHTPEADV